MNNYIQQKLSEFDTQFGFVHNDCVQRYENAPVMCDNCKEFAKQHSEKKKWIEQALKDTVWEVLKEVTLTRENINELDIVSDPRTHCMMVMVKQQKEKHQQILDNL